MVVPMERNDDDEDDDDDNDDDNDDRMGLKSIGELFVAFEKSSFNGG